MVPSLRRQDKAVLTDRQPGQWASTRPKELILRLLAGECEMCGRTGNIQVHHVRKLADLGPSGQPGQPAWAQIMARRRRKTLMVCLTDHLWGRTPRPASLPHCTCLTG